MMKSQRVLIVDDESTLRAALFKAFERRGFQVTTATRIEEARSILPVEAQLDLALVDLRLPDGDGIEFMEYLKNLYPNCQVLILTGNGSIESAVRATQKGAFHFITKPFNLDELFSLVDKALYHKLLKQENQQLKTELTKKYRFEQIIGRSEQLQHVLDLVERVADTDSTILVTGESGTGKELIAKAIHTSSGRAVQPFIPVNCGAIPKELLESELFGHVKGAFTGSVANRIGRFELADGGTLFLDEIGDMDPTLQVKLLRVLQERKFEPVGSTKTVSVNVRIVAATNIDLEEAVAAGKFREDLYYRLNVIPIHIPPLCERPADIPLLIGHFIDLHNKNKNRQITGISDEALNCLMSYSWPGNIRELENLVERLAILKGQGRIEVSDLPNRYQIKVVTEEDAITAEIPTNGIDFNTAVDSFENQLILRALEKTGWNRNQAAILLRLNRTTLVEKMKKKGLKPPPEAMGNL